MGNVIRGDKLILTAQKISDVQLINRTGRHRARLVTGTRNAECVIDRAIKTVREKKKKK